uniref:Uncharacterized protein n=2 Tax=Aegilops tauschii subsp. strangulata TaxID=200361 RepID=A0A453RF69_AEGTS
VRDYRDALRDYMRVSNFHDSFSRAITGDAFAEARREVSSAGLWSMVRQSKLLRTHGRID